MESLIPKPKKILAFTLAYLVFFTGAAIYENNFEFLFYTGIMIILIWIVVDVYHRVNLQKWVIGSLSLLGLLHLAGGNIYFYGTRLYDVEWFRYPFLVRYDNIVHLFGTFVLTFLVYNLVQPIVDLNLRKRKRMLFMGMLILMALGVGSLNEIIEFIAVVIFDAADKVGDYDNNARDLVYNLAGALMATGIIYHYYKEAQED